MLECAGRVVVTGMGKSGHIGHKIARHSPAWAHLPSSFIRPMRHTATSA